MGVSLRTVCLILRDVCEVEGLSLPPGTYVAAQRQEVLVDETGRAIWQQPSFTLTLAQPRLGQIGGPLWTDRPALDVDVTASVTANLMHISADEPPLLSRSMRTSRLDRHLV